MSKKDISKLITSGTPKQRIILATESVARGKFNKDPLLTDNEFRAISESFKKPNEIKLWNKFRRADEVVTNAIINLQGLMFEVKMHYSDLRGYILVWNSIENAELMVNAVLHEIRDPEERRRAANKGAKGIDILFSKTTPDEEGYIEIKIDFENDTYTDEKGKLIDYKAKPRKTKEHSLWHVMNNVKANATATAIRFVSWRAAILDYMEEQGFNIKSYKEKIDDLTQQIYTPVIGWTKYQSDEKSFIGEVPQGRRDKLKDKYAITPNPEEFKVDKDIYDWFKAQFLDE